SLQALGPEFFSVTYGAGGSTRDNTFGLVKSLREQGIDVAPHLSFGGDDEASMTALLDQYKALGVKRLVALRGDIPSGVGAVRMVYANELVEFIRAHSGDYFEIEVAAYPEVHPESASYNSEIHYFKQKMAAGADSAVTQYFFNPDSYFRFVDACSQAGIQQPIYVGLMPITNFANLQRFSKACGAEIPRWLTYKLESFGNDEASMLSFGQDFIIELGQKLLAGGCPGIHIYSMNQLEPTRTIFNALRG
ncbi:MAG: methylenetetrahydrofolate reductase, partial [Pseudomonadales bacterium]|nr:methylenetetrahydrofolate reductase [Pseudomonadales bacterium]